MLETAAKGHPMMLGNEIENRCPQQVAVVKRFMARALGIPSVPKSEEFDARTVIFRTPSRGLVAFSEEFLEETPAEEIPARLFIYDVARRAQELGKGQRLVVTTSGVG